MNRIIFLAITILALFCLPALLNAVDVMSSKGVKCTYTHHDMWKGRIAGEGLLFLEISGGNERIYIAWGNSKDALVQKEVFSLKKVENNNQKKDSELPWYQEFTDVLINGDKEKMIPVPPPPYYREFTDVLNKAVEWDKTADANNLEDVRKMIALGWAYHKLKKGTPGWISKTWGTEGKYELIEIRISEIPKLLELFEEVPALEKKFQEETKKLKDEADTKKAQEKAKKDKVDSLLK